MIKKLLISLLCISWCMMGSVPALAATDVFQGPCSQPGANSSAACQSTTTSNPLVGSDGIITKVTELVAIVTGIAAVIMIIIGGFMYIAANGDSSRINNAKTTITYAVVGLVVAAIAQGIVTFVISKL